MVTTFNKKDLRDFGRFIFLSDDLDDVNFKDVDNFISSQNEYRSLESLNSMCIESLDPEELEAWEKVKEGLMRTRSSLKN